LSDESHFVRNFKSAYGMRPTMFRRNRSRIALPAKPAKK
jgi:AraC-like DNA-binding protein